MEKFEEKIGYGFKNPQLLKEALTHSSYANENSVASYERLEFLGDAVLDLVISRALFDKKPRLSEGELTKMRAAIVCEQSLSDCAKRLEIGKYIYFNKGEELSGGRERISILADVTEAVIAAIYLDGGFAPAEEFVIKNLGATIEAAIAGKAFKDYKTELQELIQAQDNSEKIVYREVSESGPAHRRVFEYEVLCGDKVLGKGTGATKKEAEQNAAKVALSVLK